MAWEGKILQDIRGEWSSPKQGESNGVHLPLNGACDFQERNSKGKILQDIQGEWSSPKQVEIRGVRLPFIGVRDFQEFHDGLPRFQTRHDDVFVVTYPKSGTTWVQEILWQIYNAGETSNQKIRHRVPCLEFERLLPKSEIKTSQSEDGIVMDSLPSPRLIKSHLPYHAIPKGDNNNNVCKYIYVARNPKDAVVSSYHFALCFVRSGNGFSGPWEFYCKLFMEGKVTYGTWHEHVLGWWKHRNDANILFLKYEDLKKDLSTQVRIIAQFIGKPLTDEVIACIAEQCTFKGMMKNASNYNSDEIKYLRKGEVGNWKNYFTPELETEFQSKVVDKIKGTGLEFDFGE